LAGEVVAVEPAIGVVTEARRRAAIAAIAASASRLRATRRAAIAASASRLRATGCASRRCLAPAATCGRSGSSSPAGSFSPARGRRRS